MSSRLTILIFVLLSGCVQTPTPPKVVPVKLQRPIPVKMISVSVTAKDGMLCLSPSDAQALSFDLYQIYRYILNTNQVLERYETLVESVD